MALSRTGITTAVAAAAVAIPLSLGGLAPQAHAQSTSPSPTPTGTSTASSGIFGPGCSSLPRTGVGSAAVMAKQKLVAAASGNPQLSMLIFYVNRARIADALDTANNITLFAPTNAAWQKLSSSQRASLATNPTQLKKVLNYHVVNQHVTKAELPNGSFTTREGSKLTTSGSGTTFKVNNTADIVCGNIPTVNATVYLVDTVLMPPS
ncbi:fasciclin domain-containing protein [Actinacidiphila rubida]|uniref:Uncaracterized surface protein containing fasciclin (FAS1) repeats n=1 Tax=Actinacidiphila rubida TaxID=310780 RepID=A0A1H8ECC8_9ACTN|nr:fasciclin domain-containing protein [Actinacidiphila rubida]SEN17135.1 Uncaracterized surface protein containing fasciclin (FAS1) repeats [Actinacidiphila rubida]